MKTMKKCNRIYRNRDLDIFNNSRLNYMGLTPLIGYPIYNILLLFSIHYYIHLEKENILYLISPKKNKKLSSRVFSITSCHKNIVGGKT